MLSEDRIDAAAETVAELERKRDQRPQEKPEGVRRTRPASPDEIWARKNLRWKDGRPILDLANVLRVLNRHEDFAGRFKYDDTLNKVLDKGSVMLDWRLAEVCSVIQERFLPAIPESDVQKALLIHANQKSQKK